LNWVHTLIDQKRRFICFVAASGSLASGGLFNTSGWGAINYGMVPFLATTLIATLWYQWGKRSTFTEQSENI